MPGFSNYAELQALKWLLTADAVTRPTTFFLALFTSDPGETGAGTEVSGGGYARQPITFSGAANPVVGPATQITFTATAAWGTITHWAVYDLASAGNFLVSGALTASRTIASGDSAVVSVGALSVSLD